MAVTEAPCVEQSKALAGAHEYFNEVLFSDELGDCMTVWSRNNNIIGGYFSPDRWSNEEGKSLAEIAINANLMSEEPDYARLFTILIHEMCHQWQFEYGKKPKNGYHDKQWAAKAKEVGLQPISAEDPKKETGEKIDTNLIPDGKAALAIANMPEELLFPWFAEALHVDGEGQPQPGDQPKKGPAPRRKSGKRAKYTCPICGLNVWAKGGVRIMCMDDDAELVEAKI